MESLEQVSGLLWLKQARKRSDTDVGTVRGYEAEVEEFPVGQMSFKFLCNVEWKNTSLVENICFEQYV